MNYGDGFEVSPPPISVDDIKGKVNTDVVVVGAGIAGLSAAASAAEAGAKTILLEKGVSFHHRGLHNTAIASRLQKKAGIKVDKDQVIYTIMEWSAYRANQKVVKVWADNCDKVMDWLINVAKESNVEVILDPTTKPWYFPNYPVIHVFMPKWQESLGEMLLNKGRAHGAEYHWETPAVRLLRNGQNRVHAVIARNKQGEHIQFNVSRAVVLCTGDYGGDRQMVEKYCWPAVSGLRCAYLATVPEGIVINTGDGHKMGMWIGAAIDEPPHCANLFDFSVWNHENELFNLARQPWLYVDLNGKRFMNEDLPWGYECAQIMQQPGGVAWSVWDAEWEKDVVQLHSQCCKNMGPPTYLWDPKQLDFEVGRGNVLTAQTLDELAQKMEVPVKNFKATVVRYNELARKGKDPDFGKYPDRLTTLEKPPFYASQMQARYMVILGGLQINTRLQVIDAQKKAIPGLYAAGNVSGSFFGSQYPTTIPGLTHSRAWTFGRLAGLNAAAEKVHGR